MVKAWKEKLVIPTYEVGKPEKNPIFLEILFRYRWFELNFKTRCFCENYRW